MVRGESVAQARPAAYGYRVIHLESTAKSGSWSLREVLNEKPGFFKKPGFMALSRGDRIAPDPRGGW